MKKEDFLKYQKEYRIKNNNAVTKRYEKTKRGFLVRVYRNMKSRVTGVQKLKQHLYLNKDLLDKNIFYEWSLNNNDFNRLFDVWEKSNYPRTITPSIDRVNSDKGYVLDNMRWITFSENCRNTKRVYN